MSIFAYNSKNTITSTPILFHGRRLYQKRVKRHATGYNYIDFWYSKPLYGKVNNDFNIIQPIGEKFSLVRDGMQKDNILALDFVADAFNAMSLYVQRKNSRNKIPSSFFNPVRAYKGWNGINGLYKTHVEEIYSSLVDTYLKKNVEKRISTYETFLPVFIDYLNLITNQGYPVTKSGLIASLRCPYEESGLAISIAREMDASNDQAKYLNYFSKPAFVFYVQTAMKFGFYVDMNAPWRLVANLESPAWSSGEEGNPILSDIREKYFEGTYSIDKVFDNFYARTHLTDIEDLRIIAMQFYNSFVKQSPVITTPQVCSNRVRIQKTNRYQISRQRFDMINGDIFWLRLYMHLRIKEMEVDVSKSELKHFLTNIEQTYNSQGYDSALQYISDELSSLLDDQMNDLLILRQRGKNLLTNSSTPDILLQDLIPT